MSTRRQRGFQTEEILAEYLRPYFPGAETPTRGARGNDILGIPGVVFEVKATHECRLTEWMTKARSNCKTPDDIPVAVWRRDGDGPANVGHWPVVIDVATLAWLMKEAGL